MFFVFLAHFNTQFSSVGLHFAALARPKLPDIHSLNYFLFYPRFVLVESSLYIHERERPAKIEAGVFLGLKRRTKDGA